MDKEKFFEEIEDKYGHNIDAKAKAFLVESIDLLGKSMNTQREGMDKQNEIVEKLRETLADQAESANALGRKVLFLNFILTAATLIGAIAAAVSIFWHNQ